MMSGKMLNKRSCFGNQPGLLTAGSVALVIGVFTLAPWDGGGFSRNAFGPSVAVLRVLILAALFSYMGHLVGFNADLAGRSETNADGGAVGLVSNLVLNLIFIPRYGMMAGAW